MFVKIFDTNKNSWISVLVLGIVCVAFGTLCLLAPDGMAQVFMMLVGFLFLGSGLASAFPAFSQKRAPGFGSLFLILIGILAVLSPQSMTSAIIALIGFGLFLMGGMGLVGSFAARAFTGGLPAAQIVTSLVALVSGIVIFSYRTAGLIFFMSLFSFVMLFLGGALIALSFSIKKISKKVEEMHEEYFSNANPFFGNVFQDPANPLGHDPNVIEVDNLADKDKRDKDSGPSTDK